MEPLRSISRKLLTKSRNQNIFPVSFSHLIYMKITPGPAKMNPTRRAVGACPTTPTLVRPKNLSFMVKALYFGIIVRLRFFSNGQQ